jgi:serine protease Do
MYKKPVIAALVLITIGIIIGALIVSNISGGVEFGFAGDQRDVKLGAPTPVTNASQDLQALNNNFVAVSKATTPTVVAITVTTSAKKSDRNVPRDFFHFFGPDFKFPEPQPEQGSGSGVIISSEGYIATNNHVVGDADKDGIEVTLYDRRKFRAKLIGTDPTTDLAVIKIEATDLRVTSLGNSDNVQVGEWVLAIGNPLGLTSTVTAGIISALGRNIQIINDSYGIENFIQTDAAINPGNSGGALVNMNGELIGINTAIATTNARYQGYGFAVPVNLLKTVAADLIKEGKVRRGYIGIQIKTVDQTLASALGLKKAEGVFVDGVVANGAGAAAGVKERDVVVAVDGKDVNAANELQSIIASKHPGDVVTLKILRDGKVVEKKVTLQARDEVGSTVAASDRDRGGEEEERSESTQPIKFDNLGLSVRPMTTEEKSSLDVKSGIIVSDVRPYKEAFDRGLREGDVVVEADRKEVDSPTEFKRIVDARKSGDSVLLRVKRPNGPTTYIALQIQEQ